MLPDFLWEYYTDHLLLSPHIWLVIPYFTDKETEVREVRELPRTPSQGVVCVIRTLELLPALYRPVLVSSRVLFTEGNGTPLQYSRLENPMDGGAWWATIYGIAQSRTQLKWLSSSSSRGGGHGELLFKLCFWDERVLEMDDCDGCTTISLHLMPQHYTLKNSYDSEFCYIYFPTIKKIGK